MNERKILLRQGEQYLLHTYNRYPLALDHGDGVYLYDTDQERNIWISLPESQYSLLVIIIRNLMTRSRLRSIRSFISRITFTASLP